MAANLTQIDPEPPCESIDELLNDLRDLHAKGQLSAVAVVMVFRDGCTSHGHSMLHSRSTMIGGIERLKFKLCKDGE